jgi:hypothetical protein
MQWVSERQVLAAWRRVNTRRERKTQEDECEGWRGLRRSSKGMNCIQTSYIVISRYKTLHEEGKKETRKEGKQGNKWQSRVNQGV